MHLRARLPIKISLFLSMTLVMSFGCNEGGEFSGDGRTVEEQENAPLSPSNDTATGKTVESADDPGSNAGPESEESEPVAFPRDLEPIKDDTSVVEDTSDQSPELAALNKSLNLFEDKTLASKVGYEGEAKGTVTYKKVNGANFGSLEFNDATGEFSYQPVKDYAGFDQFTYSVTDDSGVTSEGKIVLSIIAVNDKPTIENVDYAGQEDSGALTVKLSAFDVDSSEFEFSLSGTDQFQDKIKNFDPMAGTFDFVAEPDENGSFKFYYSAKDSGMEESELASITINIAPVNDKPIAKAVNLNAIEDAGAQASMLMGEDIDGDPISFIVTEQPANGTVSSIAADGSFTYTPNANYNGSDRIGFKVTDGIEESDNAYVTVTVANVNDKPLAKSLLYTTEEDTQLGSSGSEVYLDVLSNIDNLPLEYAIVSQPAPGALELYDASKGAFRYTPALNFNGSVSFVFAVKAVGSTETSEATAMINVTPVNDKPTAGNFAVTAKENTAKQIIFADYISDVESADSALSISILTQPAKGTLSVANGIYTYTPNADYVGSDSFSYSVSDGQLQSDPAMVSITIENVNDKPTAVADTFLRAFDQPLAGKQLVGMDPDGDSLTYELVAAATSGTVSIDANTGLFSYTPDAGYNGADDFTFRVVDTGGLASDPAKIEIKIENYPPVVDNLALATDLNTPVTGQVVASDADGDGLTYAIVDLISGAQVSVSATGLITYNPKTGFGGTDTFKVAVSDGVYQVYGEVTVEVKSVVVDLCKQTTPSTSIAKISYAPRKDCQWNKNGNLGRLDQYLQARESQTQTIALQPNTVICDLKLTSSQSNWRYDDNFVLNLSKYVLTHSNPYLIDNSVGTLSVEDGFTVWNFDTVKGAKYNLSANPADPCLGNADTCMIPGHDMAGAVNLSFKPESMVTLATKLLDQNSLDFHLLTTGDNDNGDCEHTGIDFDVEIKYVIKP